MKITKRNGWRMRDNILAVYYASNEAERTTGLDWYVVANGIAERLAEEYGKSVDTVAAVISHLSPNNKWSRNVGDAETMLSAHAVGLGIDEFTVCTYSQNKRNAWAVLNGDIGALDGFNPRAQKTANFASLIANPTGDGIVIDGHAIGIAMGHRQALNATVSIGIAAYHLVSKAYREAAAIVGLQAHQMQAVTWTAWRNTHLGLENVK